MIRRARRPFSGIAVLAILLAGGVVGAETSYHRSNAAAMVLDRIAPNERAEHEYHLVRERRSPELEVQTLYRGDDELLIKRLELHDGRVVAEEQHEHDRLRLRREFDDQGRLKAEEFYEADELHKRLEYRYRAHRVDEITALDAVGERLYHERYSYRSDGRLRRVLRDGAFQAEFGFLDGVLRSEQHEYEEHHTALRYDSVGRLTRIDTWLGDRHDRVHEFQYRSDEPNAELASERIMRVPHGEEELFRYRVGELLRDRVLRVAGEVLERDEYAYDDDGRVVGERRYRRDFVRAVSYEYDEDGALRTERWARNGEPELLREYQNAERMSELHFRDGAAVLRVEYRGEQRLREEVLRNGEVVRVREYVDE